MSTPDEIVAENCPGFRIVDFEGNEKQLWRLLDNPMCFGKIFVIGELEVYKNDRFATRLFNSSRVAEILQNAKFPPIDRWFIIAAKKSFPTFMMYYMNSNPRGKELYEIAIEMKSHGCSDALNFIKEIDDPYLNARKNKL